MSNGLINYSYWCILEVVSICWETHRAAVENQFKFKALSARC